MDSISVVHTGIMTHLVEFNIRVYIPKSVASDDWRYVFTKVRGTRIVRINRLEFTTGTVMAFFDPRDWNVAHDGLIYNNPTFIRELRKAMSRQFGIPIRRNDIQYSEQGLQESSYIHMDISPRLNILWRPLNIDEMKRIRNTVKWSDKCDAGLRKEVDDLIVLAQRANKRLTQKGDMSIILQCYDKLHVIGKYVKRTLNCMTRGDPHYTRLRDVYDIISRYTNIV